MKSVPVNHQQRCEDLERVLDLCYSYLLERKQYYESHSGLKAGLELTKIEPLIKMIQENKQWPQS